MKKFALLLTLASFASFPAWGQPAKQPAEKPQAAKEAKPAAAVASAEGKKSSRRSEDARHCLEKASNTEIIKCAEAYL